VEHADNFNCTGDHSVENDVAAKGKTLNSRSQLLSLAPRARLLGEQLNRLAEFVDESVSVRDAVISNVAPNLD
jgi:hypothetical protein